MIFFGSWTLAPVLATNWEIAGKSALHGKRRALLPRYDNERSAIWLHWKGSRHMARQLRGWETRPRQRPRPDLRNVSPQAPRPSVSPPRSARVWLGKPDCCSIIGVGSGGW